MIEGTFHNGHPRITLTVIGPESEQDIEFVVDTGFQGGIALPARLTRSLVSDYQGTVERMLANGTIIEVPMYEVAVEWDGIERRTQALLVEGMPLLGTEFLAEHLLTVETTEEGAVTVEAL